jgi:hypothetical protein
MVFFSLRWDRVRLWNRRPGCGFKLCGRCLVTSSAVDTRQNDEMRHLCLLSAITGALVGKGKPLVVFLMAGGKKFRRASSRIKRPDTLR